LTVTNNSTMPDRLNCVSDDATAKCQIHTMTMEIELKHLLEPGKTAEATLQFEKAGTVKVEFPIAAIGASAPGAATGGGSMMHGGSMSR
jgi:copper(I)-binding protein